MEHRNPASTTHSTTAPNSIDMLEPLPWLPVLETGNEAIDRDHRQAVEDGNALLRIIDARKSWPDLLAAVRWMRDRSARHFETEDRILKRSRFPEADRHRRAHRRILAEIGGTLAELESLIAPEAHHWRLALAPMTLLVDHCLRDDLKFKSHVMQYEPSRR